MSSIIRINNTLVKANASIQVANKLLSTNNDLPVLIPYRKGNKWGFCDRNKNIVIECKYDFAKFGNKNIHAVMMYGKWGFIDKKNALLTPFRYDTVSNFHEGFANVSECNHYGFINEYGEEISHQEYARELFFFEGLAAVQSKNYGGGKWGYIDTANNKIISFKYQWARNFSEGLAAICDSNKWGFINKAGEVVIPIKYDAVCDFSEGLAAVVLNNKVGYVNAVGEEKIRPQFSIDYFENFSHGVAKIQTFESSRIATIDKQGNELGIEDLKALHGRTFSLWRDGSLALLRDGVIIPLQKSITSVAVEIKGSQCKYTETPLDLRTVRKWGVLNSKGEIILEPVGIKVNILENNFIQVWHNGRNNMYSLFNKEGNVILPCVRAIYDNNHLSFCDNYEYKTGSFVYNKNTRSIMHVPVVRDRIHFINGFAVVELFCIEEYQIQTPDYFPFGRVFGYVDESGTQYWED